MAAIFAARGFSVGALEAAVKAMRSNDSRTAGAGSLGGMSGAGRKAAIAAARLRSLATAKG